MTDRELRKLLREMGEACKKKRTAPGTTLKTWGLGLRTDTMREGAHVPKPTPENRQAAVVAMQSQQVVPSDTQVGEGDSRNFLIDAFTNVNMDHDFVAMEFNLLREQLVKELPSYNTVVGRNVGAHLTVFDGLIGGLELHEIAGLVLKKDGTRGVTSQRVEHMIETIKSMPSWKRFEREMRSTLHA